MPPLHCSYHRTPTHVHLTYSQHMYSFEYSNFVFCFDFVFADIELDKDVTQYVEEQKHRFRLTYSK